MTYYASGNHDLQPSEGDPSPLLTPDLSTVPATEPLQLPPPTQTSEPSTEVMSAPQIAIAQVFTLVDILLFLQGCFFWQFQNLIFNMSPSRWKLS